jgi:hypothetical protein
LKTGSLLRSVKGTLLAARARRPEFMAGVRGVRPFPRVGVRPVWSSSAAWRHAQKGEHGSNGRLVAVDGENDGITVASVYDEEGVWICLARFQGVSYSALIALCARTLGLYTQLTVFVVPIIRSKRTQPWGVLCS